MKKRIITSLLAVVLIMGLAACGNSTDETNTASDSLVSNSTETESTEVIEDTETAVKEETVQTETTEAVETDNTDIEKTLVVYYSATGTTEGVANMIAAETGADLFEIEPADDYSSEDLDWTNDESRVSLEHANPASRDMELITSTVENWDTYETVYIGYPIWWGIAAWPVDAFVKANDFTGKTVVTFCTASSSGLGESGKLLAELAGTGDWINGERFRSSTSAEEIREWIEKLEV